MNFSKVKITWKSVIAIIASIYWIYMMRVTDAHYIAFFFVGVAIICISLTERKKTPLLGDHLLIMICSVLFSVTNVFPQYAHFIKQTYPEAEGIVLYQGLLPSTVAYASLFIAGVVMGYFFFRWLYDKKDCYMISKQNESANRFAIVFFVIITALDLLFLFFVANPGIVPGDGMWQILQVNTGEYNNHHPYWHSRMIGMIFGIARFFSSNPNDEIRLYLVIQILIVNAVMAYAFKMMLERGVHKVIVCISAIFMITYPYQVMYSATLLKDMTFSWSLVLMSLMYYEIVQPVDSKNSKVAIVVRYVLYFLAATVVALSRNNGWAVVAAFAILLLFFFWKNQKKLVIGTLMVVVGTYIMIGPMEQIAQVTPTESSEKFGIPLQQMARIIAENGLDKFSDEELTYILSAYKDVGYLPFRYQAECVDPIKVYHTNIFWINDNTDEFLKGYIELAKEYPSDYLKAWVDLTKGYYSVAGYRDFMYMGVETNNLGYTNDNTNSFFELIYQKHLELYDSFILQGLKSAGLFFWVVFVAFILSIFRRNKTQGIFCLPFLLLVGTLMLAVPINHEMRYVYSLILVAPFMIGMMITRD